MARPNCLTDEDVAAFVTATLEGAALRRVEAHLDACHECMALVGEFGRVFTSVSALADPSRAASVHESLRQPGLGSLSALLESALEGEHLGPYLVRGVVGWGGAAVVFAGLDQRLDRPVALKILATAGISAATLKAEAQTAARLVHPNVVEVYDVLQERGRVVIVMELVDHGTLRTWQQTASRAEIVTMYCAAAEGLAAAHTAGLVHRDFKPDNVLVGRDGRPRVSDFGLAATIETSTAASEPRANRGAVGTPSYMAPEQRRGEAVDGRADQYSFCVALAEALTGSKDVEALNELPRSLSGALRRGMAEAPSDRWPSMRNLLAALRPRTRTWRTWAVAAGAVAATSAVVAVAAITPPDGCEQADAAARALWNPQRRQALRLHFAATDPTLGPPTWTRVDDALDQWVQGWSEQRVAACVAARTQGEAEPEQTRLECLRVRLDDATAWVDTLADADKAGLTRSVEGTAQLTPASDCSRTVEHTRANPPPALSRAAAARRIGAYEQAHALAAAALQDVPVDDDRMLAMVRCELGASASKAGQTTQATDAYTEAYWNAASVDDPRLMVRAAAGLAHHLAARAGQPDLADPWIEHARAAAARDGADEGLHADVAAAEASLFTIRGDHGAAVVALNQAIERRTQLSAPPIAIARLRANRALALNRGGDLKAAEAEGRAAVQELQALLGPDHPMVASSTNTLATVLTAMRRYDEALVHHRRVLAIRERSLGKDHPDTASSVGNIALVYKDSGRTDQAIHWYTRALATMRRNPNVVPANLAVTLSNLAGAHVALEQYDAAQPLVDEAHELLSVVLGPDHPTVATIGANAASLHSRLGDLAWADAQFPRSLESLEAKVGPKHPHLVGPLTNWAEHHLRAGRPTDAIPLLDRARALVEAAPERFGIKALGTIAFAQARGLHGAPEHAARAEALGRQALMLYATAPHQHGNDIAEIAAWLSAIKKK